MKFKFYSFTLGALMLGMMASCSNEVSDPKGGEGDNNSGDALVNLVKDPDAIVWSGDETIGNTFTNGRSAMAAGENETKGETYVHNDEVEVNLAILDSHEWDGVSIDDLVTKLSIHVRKATDVKVTLPLPTTFVIESDDLYIFHEHWTKDHEAEGAYGVKELLGEGATHELPFKVGEKTVKLQISFADNAVTVTTDGIDSDVMDACIGHNGDGLNFEVYIYNQTSAIDEETGELVKNATTRVQLKEQLDNSTIEFLDAKPTYYINAFGWEMLDDYDYSQGNVAGDDWHANTQNSNHCVVSAEVGYKPVTGPLYEDGVLVDAESDHFYHLNGTPFNYIYVYGDATPDHAHGYFEVPEEEEQGAGAE